MISVENSVEKRIFHLSGKENEPNFIKFKNEIIESIRNNDYSNLHTLKDNEYAKQFSVFIFYEKIQSQISKISNHIIKNQLENLEWFKVLVGNFEEIKELIQNNEYILAQRNPELPDFKKYKDIFEDLYEKQLSGNEKLKKQFFNLFENLNVCPYCNRNFVSPIYKENSIGTDNKNQSPDIEHFFPKSIYPFLSLSISNLLPSCAFCNKIKSDVDTYKHNCLSPYEIKNSDFRFDFCLELNQVKKVKLISKTDCKNSEILHLESLYNEVHSRYINDIFENDLKYTRKNKEFLDTFKILTEDDYKKVFRNYYKEEDFNKNPLSKMTKDLYNQIKNLKGDKS
ncbi:hypothetical protein AN286_05225 [Aliarcobacter cryaerophilus ATCC 43158]|uniref:HNH nuclease domain-containing protein n=2 Tax=Pseudomonadati TaxID=3379134 RepID=A0AAD0TV70_9BACT|nr:hypothetical protein [Aliarcobacter cryaerophilus]AYJ79575.1 hypothetical protein ACRYA_0420 [Aliarcobacter cryaerophilus ATCC 43158]PRM93858.1 hypothetical protein CJ667_10270 [Aliarcobacter cryaerophilus]QCZ23822.1 hypothetical protein AN286_05225 [Aliarcobacter cryaerophilus ATCC 43158]